MALKMYRGRTQSLFRFLPQQVYNWENRQGSFRGLDDVDARPLDVPAAWVKRPLRRLVAPFVASARQAGVNFPGLDIVEGERFELLEPQRFRGELFPRTYVCLLCDRFFTSDDPPRRVRCPDQTCRQRGGARTEQWSFVEYHGCGHLAGMTAPQCVNNCRAGMRLINRDSRSLADWQWRCVRCGTPARGVYHGCPACRRGQVKVLRGEAGPVFQAQFISVVNAPSRADYAMLEGDRSHLAAIGQALGLVEPGLEGIRRAVTDPGAPQAEAELREQLIRQFGFDADDPVLQDLLNRRRRQAQAGPDWAEAVNRLNLTPEELDELGFECLELTLAREASALPLDRLIREAPSPSLRGLYETIYPETFTRYGLAEVTLLREFPLLHLAAVSHSDGRRAA